MRKLIVPAVVTGSALLLVVVIMSLGGTPPTLATVAPAETVIWLESADLEGSYQAFKDGPAWSDFESSESLHNFTREWERLVERTQGEQLFQELGIELNEATVMDFIGQSVALAVVVAPDRAPALLLLTELDVLGLIAKADTGELWDKLVKGSGLEGAEEFHGVQIASWKQGEGPELFVSLIDTVIAISHDKDTVKSAILTHAGEAPSLAAQERFSAELASLEPSVAFGWIDLGWARDGERVKETFAYVGQLGGPGVERDLKQFEPAMLDVLDADLSDEALGLAVGVTVGEGNLYDFRLAASRDAEGLFKEASTKSTRELVDPDVIAYLEMRGLRETMDGFRDSETLDELLAIEIVEWLMKQAKDPQGIQGLMGQARLGRGMPSVERNPTFEVRMLLAMLGHQLAAMYGNDVTFALSRREAPELQDVIGGMLIVEPAPALRIAADIAFGVAATRVDRTQALDVFVHNGRSVYTALIHPDYMSLQIAQVGPYLVFGNQLEEVKALIDREKGQGEPGLASNDRIKAAVGRLKGEPLAFGYYDLDGFQALAQDVMKTVGPQMGAEAREIVETRVLGRLDSQGFDYMTGAMHVAKDYTSTTSYSWGHLSPSAPQETKDLIAEVEGEPQAWSCLPPTTFFSIVSEVPWAPLFEQGLKVVESQMPAQQLESGREKLREILGERELQRDFLAHVDSSFGLGIMSQEQTLPAGAPPEAAERVVTLPALVICSKLKDAAAFEASLVGWLEWLFEEHDANGVVLKTIQVAGERAFALEPDTARDLEQMQSRTGLSVGPCFGFSEDFLIVASSQPALRQAIESLKGGGGLAKSEDFAKILGDTPREVPMLVHFDTGGLTRQLSANASLIVANFTPPPADLQPPEYPEFPSREYEAAEGDWRAQDEVTEKWEQEQATFVDREREYHEKLAKWRADSAKANTAEFHRLLDGVGPLLSSVYYSRRLDDETVESAGTYRLILPTKR